jgi:hypothetical protein
VHQEEGLGFVIQAKLFHSTKHGRERGRAARAVELEAVPCTAVAAAAAAAACGHIYSSSSSPLRDLSSKINARTIRNANTLTLNK